jgi:hypothetical protein
MQLRMSQSHTCFTDSSAHKKRDRKKRIPRHPEFLWSSFEHLANIIVVGTSRVLTMLQVQKFCRLSERFRVCASIQQFLSTPCNFSMSWKVCTSTSGDLWRPVLRNRMACSAFSTSNRNLCYPSPVLDGAKLVRPLQSDDVVFYTHVLCPFAERTWLCLLHYNIRHTLVRFIPSTPTQSSICPVGRDDLCVP